MNDENTALLVVDMQRDFCHPDGALYSEHSEEIIPNVNEVVKEVDARVFYTADSHEEDADEFDKWGRHCVTGTWGYTFHPDLYVDYQATEIQKDTYDAFHDTDLHEQLQNLDIEKLIICGTLVNVCVQETASSAALHGYDVSVVEDAVGYINDAQKQAALNHMDFLYADIITTSDL